MIKKILGYAILLVVAQTHGYIYTSYDGTSLNLRSTRDVTLVSTYVSFDMGPTANVFPEKLRANQSSGILASKLIKMPTNGLIQLVYSHTPALQYSITIQGLNSNEVGVTTSSTFLEIVMHHIYPIKHQLTHTDARLLQKVLTF